ncbi:MAG: type II toxin-antitoxin system RelE/ParE family toxin [Planctomycetes bacterium]|nr:type II toxin-antitoxin system RelE/ParE family toxin [Planctomycetota bacterium]
MKRYTVHVTPAAWKEMKNLPGQIRQRVRKAVDALADDPRPAKSKALDLPELPTEVRRLRLDRWRIVYAVSDADETVDVLAVRKRPPYDYGDLEALLKDFPSG